MKLLNFFARVCMCRTKARFNIRSQTHKTHSTASIQHQPHLDNKQTHQQTQTNIHIHTHLQAPTGVKAVERRHPCLSSCQGEL